VNVVAFATFILMLDDYKNNIALQDFHMNYVVVKF